MMMMMMTLFVCLFVCFLYHQFPDALKEKKGKTYLL